MKKHYCRANSLRAFAMLSLLMVAHATSANSEVRLSINQADNFSGAVAALANQGHVAVVAEGVPLHPLLTNSDAIQLTTPLSVSDEIKAVATAYDYNVQREGNVVILTKRYSDPYDLPEMTQDECRYAIEQMQAVANPFNPKAAPNHIQLMGPPSANLQRSQYRIISPIVDPLMSLLTDDQLQTMQKNKLSIISLSSDEREAARRVALYLYVQQTMDQLSQMPPELDRAERLAVFCHEDTPYAHQVFGYTLPKPSTQVLPEPFHPLTQSMKLDDLHIVVTAPPASSLNGPDPTVPSPDSLPTQGTQTIADAVATLNTESKNSQTATDLGIASLPITFAGVGNAPAQQVLQALMEIYGLRLTRETTGSQSRTKLTLPSIQPPSDIAGLPAALRQCLPTPFLRASHMDQIVTDQQNFHDFWKTSDNQSGLTRTAQVPSVEETPAQLQQAMQDRQKKVGGYGLFQEGQRTITQAEATLPALRVAAIRRLRALIEPELQTQHEGVPVTSLSDAGQRAIAVIFLAEAVNNSVDLLTEPTPNVLQDFDQCLLGGGVAGNQDQPMFSISFYAPTPGGGSQMNGMYSGIDYIK